MENVKKAQQLVQVEAAKAQEELAAYVSPPMDATAQSMQDLHANESAMLSKLLSVFQHDAVPDLKVTVMMKQCGL